jgi:riboflavin kinase/FMN adenylyltransferase
MQLVSAARALAAPGRRICAAIGVFDGVHLGHQQVLRQTLADAQGHEALAVAITFDRHPNAIVAPDRVPPMIYSAAQRVRALADAGSGAVLMIPFDTAFSRLSGEEFIRGLAADFGRLVSVSVGADFAFGHRRSGNVALLQQLGAELGFRVHGLAAVSLDGQVVSSTRIRETIRAGQLDAVNQMLGRPYAMAGEVVRGRQLGSQLGFPTANLETNGLVLPPNGVYAAHARCGGHVHRAVINIGVRPTVETNTPPPRVEAHLLDFRGDLYGAEVELTLVRKLRDELRFPGLDALRAQIARDLEAARQVFTS